MTTEIREYGDAQHVIVYTNEAHICRKLEKLQNEIKRGEWQYEPFMRLAVPYYNIWTKAAGEVVGIDYYFPRKYRRNLSAMLRTKQRKSRQKAG